MKGSVLISIIIPSYNSEIGIARCLQSIDDQKYNNYEVLVIEGLSQDKTLNIIKPFSEKNSRIQVISEKDEGIYDAMNRGIDFSRGEWIYFLGSDDEFLNNSVLDKVYPTLASTSSDLVYGNVLVSGGDTVWAKNGSIYGGEFTKDRLFQTNICQQAIFYRRKIFDKIGHFNITYSTCADWDFNHRCIANCRPTYIDIVVAKFKVGGTSSTNSIDKFVSLESVNKLKAYYKISYWDKLFRFYGWTFRNNYVENLNTRQFGRAFSYFVFSLYHSKKKIPIIKEFFVILSKSIFKRLNRVERNLTL